MIFRWRPIFLLVILQASRVCGQGGLVLPTNGNNQKSKVIQWIGPVEVSITYNSPHVHGPDGNDRTGHIWGELVPYGLFYQGFGWAKEAPWRAGANETTTISFSHDVNVEGQPISAGIYGFYVIAEKEASWTLVFSKNSTAWGSAYYDSADDALRIKTTPIACAFTEDLTFGFEQKLPSSTLAYLQWELKRLSFKIEVPDINRVYVEGIRRQLFGEPSLNTYSWVNAARFCAENRINLPEALTWADWAINGKFVGRKNFVTLSAKTEVLYQMELQRKADSLMRVAIRMPDANAMDIYLFGRKLLSYGRTKEAMEIFKFNAAKNGDSKFITNLGLGRGYNGLGDRDNAIKHWDLAIKNIPAEYLLDKGYYESQLSAIKLNRK